VLVLVLLAACAADDHNPSGGGGGGGSGSGGSGDGDGGVGDGGGAAGGRLCAAIDLRDPLDCPAVDLGGIDVTAQGDTATTDDDGAFDLDLAGGALLVVGAATADVRDSLAFVDSWRGDDGVRVPTVTQDDWNQLVLDLDVVEPDGSATILLYISDDGDPVSGAEVLTPDGSSVAPFYDDGPGAWTQAGLTGSFGAALLFDVPTASAVVDLTVVVDGQLYAGSAPVEDGRLTFARANLTIAGE
jgi:hypothetical protein